MEGKQENRSLNNIRCSGEAMHLQLFTMMTVDCRMKSGTHCTLRKESRPVIWIRHIAETACNSYGQSCVQDADGQIAKVLHAGLNVGKDMKELGKARNRALAQSTAKPFRSLSELSV